MEISDPLIDKLSDLCKLEFQGEQREAIRRDLNKMLDFVEKITELDTEAVEPLIHITEATNITRQDVPELNITRAEALANAPDRDSDYFRVPKFVEKE
jgi:aspartyl-tRNA(Asn)/glutamyl-tRNA(Gln) amidotransferase subunit C